MAGDEDRFRDAEPGDIMAIPILMKEFHVLSVPKYLNATTVKIRVKYTQRGKGTNTLTPLPKNTNGEEMLTMVFDDGIWRKESSVPVEPEPESVVTRLCAAIEEHFEAKPDSYSASGALYVLSLAALKLGRNNIEEARSFERRWAALRGLFEPFADKNELLSTGKMIDDAIDQVTNANRHTYVQDLRDESHLAEMEQELLAYLDI